MSKKTCAILLAMGGPDSLDDIPTFLKNIFSDRAIINLPGGKLGQYFISRMIVKARSSKVAHNYSLIGGSSPLLKWTKAQRDHIEFVIAPVLPGFKCFIGMRYFKPYTNETVEKVIAEGFERIIFLPMYPQYCKATTGSSFLEAEKAVKDKNIETTFIQDFHNNPVYIDLLKRYISDNIRDDELLLFSAHSIPQKFVDEGDPYVDQVKECCRLAANGRDYKLSFQSRTGPVKWVSPDTVETVKELVNNQNKKLFIVPISFVCDHIETLCELDIELLDEVDQDKRVNIRRMPMFNDDREFGALLAQLILDNTDGK